MNKIILIVGNSQGVTTDASVFQGLAIGVIAALLLVMGMHLYKNRHKHREYRQLLKERNGD